MGEGNRPIAVWTLVVVLALAAAARSAWFWTTYRPTLQPDTSLYAQGGLGLFPSPVGRGIGWGGVDALAYVNTAAGFALVLAVAVLAAQLGGNVILAAVLAVLTPLSYWTIFAGVDTLGALLVVVAVAAGARRSSWLAWAGAGATHASTIPIVLVKGVAGAWAASSRRLRWLPVAAILAAITLILVLTPYGGNVAVLAHPWRAVRCALLTVGIVTVAYLPAIRRLASPGGRRLIVPVLLGTAIAAAAVGSERSSSSRYGLPAAMVMCAVAATPRARLA